MSKQQDSTSLTGWQPVASVLKRAIMQLHNHGVLPADKVTELFRKLPLRNA